MKPSSDAGASSLSAFSRLVRSPASWLAVGGGLVGLLSRVKPLRAALTRFFGGGPHFSQAFVDAGSIAPTSSEVHPLSPWSALDSGTDGPSLHVVLALSRTELRELLAAALPIRVAIGDDGWIEIRRLDALRYDPGRGVRVSCSARVHYPLALLPDDFTIEPTVVDVLPRIVPGPDGPQLAFALDIAEFDVKYLPSFVDRAIAGKLNRTLQERYGQPPEANGGKSPPLTWNLSHSLNRELSLPARVLNPRELALGPTRATVEVTNEGLVLRMVMPVRLQHAQ